MAMLITARPTAGELSALQGRVSQLIKRKGTVGAATALGVSREALVRVAAGLSVRAGTIALIRQSLAQLESQAAPAEATP